MMDLSQRPMRGVGVRVRQSPQGYVHSLDRRGKGFAHPFRAALSGMRVSVERGVVEGYEPVIGSVPISGDADNARPLLELSDLGRQETWVCVEVYPEEDNTLTKEKPPKIVHGEVPTLRSRTIGRHPLAMVVWLEGRPVQLLQITYFNLRYARINFDSTEIGVVRHFFL